MGFWSKLGRGFVALGSKASGVASFLGHKAGNVLMTLAPAVATFAPQVGAGLAGAGAIAQGIGALGDAGKEIFRGNVGGSQLAQARDGYGQVREGMQQARAAYRSARGSGLERA